MSHYSGKFVLRLSPEMHKTLTQKAKSQQTSLNRLAVKLLQEGLRNRDSEPAHDADIKSLLPLIKNEFKKNLLAVLLFGSVARGEATENSDIDLLIVLQASQPIKRNLYRWWESLPKSGGLPINPHFVHLKASTEKASGIWFEVALDCRFFYQKGRSVEDFLEKLRQQIQSGELERAWSHGHPYWIRRNHAK